MIFFTFLFLYLFLLLGFYLNSKKHQLFDIISVSLTCLCYFLIIGLATYNNDWEGYTIKFNGTVPTTELFYNSLFYVFRELGLTFRDFYIFNQILNAFLLVSFVNVFKPSSALLVLAGVLIVLGPTSSILLRFYTSFLFFINGAAYILTSKRKVLGVIFIAFSFMCHFSSVIFFLFFLVYKYELYKKTVIQLLVISIIITVSKDVSFFLLSKSGYGAFTPYILGSTSSIQGGLLAAIPIIPWFLFVFKTHFLIRKKEFVTDIKYKFLYTLSIFPALFIFLSLTVQIVLYRFIEPYIIVLITFLCYSKQYLQYSKFYFYLILTFLTVFTIYTKYYLPLSVIGNSEWLEHYTEILEYNSLIEFLRLL